MTDLKPCPFCGLQPHMWGEDGNPYGVQIECTNGHCPSEPHVWEATADKAIAAWNTRSNEATIKAVVDLIAEEHGWTRTDLIQPMIAAARQDAKEAEAYAEELEQRLNTCRMATLVEAGSDVIRASNTLMLMLAGDIALTKAGLEAADHLGYWTEE